MSDYSKRVRAILTENVGRDMVEMAFESYDQAEELIKSVDLFIEKYTQIELLPNLVPDSDLAVHKNLQHQQLWIMRRN